MDQNEKNEGNKGIKIAIIVLIILLALSACGLAAKYVYDAYMASQPATVTVPDNIINPRGEEITEPGTESGAQDTARQEESDDTAADTGTDQKDGESAGADRKTGTDKDADSDSDRERNEDKDKDKDIEKGGKPKAPVLKLYKGHEGDNEAFEARNMLPGDKETKYYCVKAYHEEEIEIKFKAEITEESKDLGEALRIRVSNESTGKELINGTMKEANGKAVKERIKAPMGGESEEYYKIEVWMETSAGNEYQEAGLKADFKWYAGGENQGEANEKEERNGKEEKGTGTGSKNKETSGLSGLPKTGERFNTAMWLTAGAAAGGLLILLIIKRKKDKGNGEGKQDEEACV